MGFGPTPTITQSLATNEFPLSEVYTPEDGINLIQGGPSSTDSLNSKKSAPVAIYLKDGNNVTQGAKADAAATDNTSSWSVIALLKGVWGFLSTLASTVSGGKIQVSGTFYQATQPVSATSLPLPTGAAQELGGNLATTATNTTNIETHVANIDTSTGTQADSAYTSGNGSLIALLKGIFGKLASTLTIAGTVTANVSFPSQQAVNVDQVNGSTLSTSNPVPVSNAVASAIAAWSSNPAATGTGTDVQYKFGSSGTTSFTRCSLQNNTAANVLYAFDQDTTTSGHMIYTLAAGQYAFWDRTGTVIHFQTASAQSFGGTAGITVEAFA